MDGSGQSHNTEVCKNTLDPKWNVHYDLYVGVNDAITISVWNDKKVCALLKYWEDRSRRGLFKVKFCRLYLYFIYVITQA